MKPANSVILDVKIWKIVQIPLLIRLNHAVFSWVYVWWHLWKNTGWSYNLDQEGNWVIFCNCWLIHSNGGLHNDCALWVGWSQCHHWVGSHSVTLCKLQNYRPLYLQLMFFFTIYITLSGLLDWQCHSANRNDYSTLMTQ